MQTSVKSLQFYFAVYHQAKSILNTRRKITNGHSPGVEHSLLPYVLFLDAQTLQASVVEKSSHHFGFL